MRFTERLKNEKTVSGADKTHPVVREWIEQNGFTYYACDEMLANSHKYCDRIAEQNIAASGTELARYFASFCTGTPLMLKFRYSRTIF